MNLTNIPPFTAVPFANGAGAGYRNTIPVASQQGVTPGAASYTDGFPPVCFEPIASGGVPPYGADFNGILYAQSVALRWEQAGGNYPFDATFAAAIGGYPKDAIVMRSDGKGQWLNTVDANSTDPDSSSAAGWIALRANTGAATIAAVAGANAPTPTQLGSQVLLVIGALTGNATLTLPLIAGAHWVVVNNTTGSYTLTVQGPTGSGVSITQGVGQLVYTDGTNYYSTSASVSGQYLPIDGTAVAATKLATARAFSLTGLVTAAVVNFDGTGNVTLNTTIADAALSIAKTSGLQSALDAKAPVQAPNVTNAHSAVNSAPGLTVSYGAIGSLTTALQFCPSLSANNYSGMTQAGDAAIIFGANASGQALVIAPWLSGGNGLRIGGDGNVTCGGSITAAGGFQSSDRRLKTNITPRPVQRGFALKLARMFCEWDRIADGVHDVGLVAQRVKAIASRYVKRGTDKRGLLAIDKAGIALEASMDNALHLHEHDKTFKALLRRIQKLENAR